VALLLVLLAGGVWWYRYQSNLGPVSVSWGDSVGEFNVDREVFTPKPLRLPFADLVRPQDIELTIAGVLKETNEERTERGLNSLTGSAVLGAAAQKKIDDMLAQQYFEHVSPTGVGPAELVDGIGYEYIRVGENLALGNFENDAALVQAWMDSPGHRENILKPGFSELGIAVGQGEFEGRQTWLAVQTFALPLSACPTPNPATQREFDTKKAEAEALVNSLNSSSLDIEVDQTEINDLAEEINALTDDGNNKIEAGNDKIEQGNSISEETGDSSQAQPYWDEGKQLQDEGQTLLTQAESKRTEHSQLTAQLQAESQTHNSGVERQRVLNSDLSSLADTLNGQVDSFNQCLDG